jgi:hypothetical protein
VPSHVKCLGSSDRVYSNSLKITTGTAPVGLSTAGQRFNRGSFRGQGPEVAAPENDELRNRLHAAEGIEGRR